VRTGPLLTPQRLRRQRWLRQETPAVSYVRRWTIAERL